MTAKHLTGASRFALLLWITFAFPTCLLAAPPQDNGEAVTFYAGASARHESNLFRLSDTNQVTQLVSPTASASDDITTGSAGLLARAHHARQDFLLDIRLDDHHFHNNDQLNHVAGHANLTWNWNLLTDLSGTLSANHYRWLGDFAESQYYGRDILTQNLTELSANYRINSRLTFAGRLNTNTIRHDSPIRRDQDSEATGGGAALEYESRARNQLALEYTTTAVTYPNDDLTNGNGTDFSDHVIRFRARYSPSPITRLTATAGYLSRNYNAATINDFSGTIGALTFDWKRIPKLDLELDAKRELQAHREQGTDYFVSDRLGITGRYQALDKLRLEFKLAHERLNYQIGNYTLITNTITRRDYRYLKTIKAVYSATSHLEWEASAGDEKRRSNIIGDDFDALYYELAVTLSL